MEMFIHMHHILSIIYIVPFLSFSTCLRDTLCILSSSDGRVFEMVRRGRGRREEGGRRKEEEGGGRREEESAAYTLTMQQTKVMEVEENLII